MSGEQEIHFFTALPYSNIFFYVHRSASYLLFSLQVFNHSLKLPCWFLEKIEIQLYMIEPYPRICTFKLSIRLTIYSMHFSTNITCFVKHINGWEVEIVNLCNQELWQTQSKCLLNQLPQKIWITWLHFLATEKRSLTFW